MQAGEARVTRPPRGQSKQETAPLHVLTEVVRGREAFLKLKKEWDAALVAGADASPSLEHDFLRLWLENFAPSATPSTLVTRRGSKISSALGLLTSIRPIDGVPVQVADGWCNAHSTRGGLLTGPDGVASIETLVKLAMTEPWDVLHLRDVPREGPVSGALDLELQVAGCEVSYDSPMDSPYITLPESWEELEKRLDSRFRQNLRRRRRRLEEHGSVGFEVVTGGEALDLALEEALTIEASGWKGHEGSAIRARPELVGFYSGWARQLAQSGRLRLCFLTLDGRRIAFQFAYVHAGRFYLPKCAFDERFAECSPGQLLMVDVLKRCLEEKLESFEFLGFSMAWKRDWTPLVRPHATLWAWRPTWRGNAARVLHTQVRPRAANLVRTLKAKWEAAK